MRAVCHLLSNSAGESKGIPKKDLVAIVTLVSAGIWLWKHRPLMEEVRRELDETGQVELTSDLRWRNRFPGTLDRQLESSV